MYIALALCGGEVDSDGDACRLSVSGGLCCALLCCVLFCPPRLQVGEMIKDREAVVYGGMTGKGLKVRMSV